MNHLMYACFMLAIFYIYIYIHPACLTERRNMNVIEAFKAGSMKMKSSTVAEADVLIKDSSTLTSHHTCLLTLLPPNSARISTCNKNSDICLSIEHNNRVDSVITTINKLVKRKLGLGARILQLGGVDKVFSRTFTVTHEEHLLMASRSCLSTTAGPVPGRLFISTHKIAFCSYRPVARASTPSGQSLRFHYKIVIPLTKIKAALESENMKKPNQKYVQVVTTDEFEFWFMGFLHYKKTLKCLQQLVSHSFTFSTCP
ncbi:hypothetical protein RND81_14G001800 [Saponaria officinalis]|uniref:GRAM domain-containing protein n=1 Tax=Saponaria officinalis TaxID=3572 RepID=A0AAW1GLJ0_SAPOF